MRKGAIPFLTCVCGNQIFEIVEIASFSPAPGWTDEAVDQLVEDGVASTRPVGHDHAYRLKCAKCETIFPGRGK